MKRLIGLLVSLIVAVAAFAQTPEEIISRMEAAMDAHENDGLVMTMDIKMPIIGTLSTTTRMLGDKFRAEGSMKDKKVIYWNDGTTKWTYDSEKNEVTVENVTAEEKEKDKQSSGADDLAMFSGITAGYDVSIKSETSSVWNLLCRKSKTNTDKDDPRTMNLVVAKGTYYPVSISAKMKGVTVTLRDLSYGVSEKDVTFNKADYPTAKIIDKRQ